MKDKRNIQEEQILVRVTGQDRPGLTASIMGILAKTMHGFSILVRQIFMQRFHSEFLSEQTRTIRVK